MITLRQLTAIASIANRPGKPPYDRYYLTHVAVYSDRMVASDGHMLIRVTDNFYPDFFRDKLKDKFNLLIHTSTIATLNKKIRGKGKDSPVSIVDNRIHCAGFREGDNLEDYQTSYPRDVPIFEKSYLGKESKVPKAFDYEYLAKMQKVFGILLSEDDSKPYTDWEITWFENKCLIESKNVQAVIMGIGVKK